jgi:voltage-gated potassium channel
VGYGDRYPTTTEAGSSRSVSCTGIALCGVVTAAIALWFVEKMTEVAVAAEARTETEVSELATELRALREEIAGLRSDSDR